MIANRQEEVQFATVPYSSRPTVGANPTRDSIALVTHHQSAKCGWSKGNGDEMAEAYQQLGLTRKRDLAGRTGSAGCGEDWRRLAARFRIPGSLSLTIPRIVGNSIPKIRRDLNITNELRRSSTTLGSYRDLASVGETLAGSASPQTTRMIPSHMEV